MADAPGIRRGRVFIRSLGTPTADWRASGADRRTGGQAYGMVGIVEVDDAAPWERERSHRFAGLLSGHGGSIVFDGRTDAAEYEEDVSFSEIDSFITRMRFPRADEIHEALGWSGGGMVLRDTRGPASPGTTLATVAIAVCLPEPVLPDAHMASIVVEGVDRPRSARIEVEGACGLPTNGLHLGQVLRMPLWGWGDEPFGFASTMRLDSIDACTKVQDAMIAGDPSKEESFRLRASVQHCVQDNSDPIFSAFRRRAAAEGLVRPWDATMTASEMLAKDKASEILIGELLKMRDREFAA